MERGRGPVEGDWNLKGRCPPPGALAGAPGWGLAGVGLRQPTAPQATGLHCAWGEGRSALGEKAPSPQVAVSGPGRRPGFAPHLGQGLWRPELRSCGSPTYLRDTWALWHQHGPSKPSSVFTLSLWSHGSPEQVGTPADQGHWPRQGRPGGRPGRKLLSFVESAP